MALRAGLADGTHSLATSSAPDVYMGDRLHAGQGEGGIGVPPVLEPLDGALRVEDQRTSAGERGRQSVGGSMRKYGRASCLALALTLAPTTLSACAYEAAAPAGPHRPLTYYVSPSGSDKATGTSPANAWRTLARADQAILGPGTRLLLQAGRSFAGNLKLTHADAGNLRRPVYIGTYGKGAAAITATSGSAVTIYDTAGVDIHGLDIRGAAESRLSGSGINVYSNLEGSGRLQGIEISGVNISGFGYGISIGSGSGAAGFSNVRVENSVVHDNIIAGLITYGGAFNPARPSYAIQNVYISHVSAYQNPGTPQLTSYSSGNGIVLGNVRHATVSWSSAYDNGGQGGSRPGPEGIWAYDSTDVIIAHDLAYGNRTRNRVDGNGFGLDENTSNSILEYDLSYGNDGAGYLVYNPTPKSNGATGNIVRFNIASGNGIDGSERFGGISILGYEVNCAVYQNTAIGGKPPRQYALELAATVRGVTVRNNIFMNQSGPIIRARGVVHLSAAQLQSNDYFSTESQFSVQWGPTTYTSLPRWRAKTGQEEAFGQQVGMTVNPGLAGPVFSLPSGPAASLQLGVRFVPGAGSPIVGKGMDLETMFGMNPGTIDFAGSRISSRLPTLGAQ